MNQSHYTKSKATTKPKKALPENASGELFIFRHKLAWLVFIICLALTFFSWHIASLHETAALQLQQPTRQAMLSKNELMHLKQFTTNGILAAGIVFSCLLFIIVWLLQNMRYRADTLARRLNQRLLTKNMALKQFSSLASHELIQPISMVRSLVLQLDKHCKENQDDKALGVIELIDQNIQHMSDLIDSLLDLAQVDVHVEHMKKISAQAMLEQALTRLAQMIDQTQTHVSYHVLPEITATPKQIELLFYNLINNAIKYRSAQHALEIEIGVKDSGKFWCFFVKDNGSGIDKTVGDKIFHLFYRDINDIEHNGHGIGLALCKKVVERHWGDIWYDSDKNKGTTVFFTIPKQQPKHADITE